MGARTGLLTCAFASTFPELDTRLQWLKAGFCPVRNDDGSGSALTVAGQWRIFTVFPSILAIAVVKKTAHFPSRDDDMKLTFMS